MSEQNFQQLLRLEVTRSLGGSVRLWRQPAGKIMAAHRGSRGEYVPDGAIECAPVGAADLSGIVAPTGVRLEVELKGARTKTTDDQVRWRESMRDRGAVALQLRYEAQIGMEANVVLACAELKRAVDIAACVHADSSLFTHPQGGVWCTACGWRSGGRTRELPR